jgi:hypothetical protein
MRKLSPLLFKVRESSSNLAAPPAKPKTLPDRMMVLRAAQKDDHHERAAAEAARGNPWARATRNQTKQGIIQNLDLDLAAYLRAEAGAA